VNSRKVSAEEYLLMNHIENTEFLYNILRNNVYPNLDRKRQNKAEREKLHQILVTFITKVAMDYAAKQGQPDEWKKLFPSHVRQAVGQLLLEHYLKGTLLFNKKKNFKKLVSTLQHKETPKALPPPPKEVPPPIPENPLELFGDVTKLVKRALNILGSVSTKDRFEKEIGRLSRIELQLICDDLKLDREGDNETLKQRIVKDFYG
jgi:hypothetical protein